jgi:methyl-accepting chemotaxis protein
MTINKDTAGTSSAATASSTAVGVKLSLRYKLVVGFFLVFSIPFAIAYYWFWHYSIDTAMSRIHDDLLSVLQGTIRGIDSVEFEALVKEGKPDASGVPSQDARYQRHQNWLIQVNWIQPKAYAVYSYIKGDGPDEIKWIGDNYRYTLPDVATKFMEPYTRTPDSLIMEGFVQDTVNMKIYEDPWGQHVSAYGPIKTPTGEIVGAVGIDFVASEVRTVQRDISRTVIISAIIAFISLFTVVYLMSSVLTEPIMKLTQAAQYVGEGDYSQDFSSMIHKRMHDEIDVLAHNFSVMVGKVYHREQTLRRQVEELKIEIDETKRSRQVEEIVDSDFFRDLQSRADRMRSRRSKPQDDSAQE